MLRLAISFLFVLTLGVAAHAADMMATIYSDGKSCPAECDAHVVFHRNHNGTANAFSPSSSAAQPQPCVNGQSCRICFSNASSSCTEAVYRGGGPARGRFDFTPAFFQQRCGDAALPSALRQKCDSFDRQFQRLTRDRVYCLANPGHAGCEAVIATAKAAQEADTADWEECKRIGESAFNRVHASDRRRQRSLACAYERFGTGGPNSSGQRWKRLLPAACHPDTFVGRDGLDCCDANEMSLGGLGIECSPFLVAR